MPTDNTGTRKGAATTKSSDSASASSAAATGNAAAEIAKALKDAGHAVVGFGVIGWNKLQVQRRELMKDLDSQRHHVETQLDCARGQLATAIRTFDARIKPVRNHIDGRLDKLSEALPAQVRDAVASARKIVHDTEVQLRQAVGAR